jgi:hypothetical protein
MHVLRDDAAYVSKKSWFSDEHELAELMLGESSIELIAYLSVEILECSLASRLLG